MSGLFDLIKGVTLLAGGAREARIEGEEAESQSRYRAEDISVKREDIQSRKELAEAQRKHTEFLQGKTFEHEKGMQKERIDWDKERMRAEQEFTRSENKFVRDNAITLAQLRIAAEKEMQGVEITSREGMHKAELKMKLLIAEMDKELRKMGFALDEKKINQDFTLGKMGVLIHAIDLAQKHTQGVEGLYTAISRTNEGMAGILNTQESSNLKMVLEAIDPTGNLGIKNIKINNYIAPISGDTKAAAADKLSSSLGIPAPKDTPLRSTAPIDQTAITPGGGLRGQDVVLDFTGKSSDEIHPGDQLGLDKVSSHIMSLPDEERPVAFGEYSQLINDPSNVFLGGQDDPSYRKKMIRYLGKTTGFDITK